jgi:hypothetical protein
VGLLAGKIRLFQEHEDVTRSVVSHRRPGRREPARRVHTADVLEPGLGLFVTPSAGTDHKPR